MSHLFKFYSEAFNIISKYTTDESEIWIGDEVISISLNHHLIQPDDLKRLRELGWFPNQQYPELIKLVKYNIKEDRV